MNYTYAINSFAETACSNKCGNGSCELVGADSYRCACNDTHTGEHCEDGNCVTFTCFTHRRILSMNLLSYIVFQNFKVFFVLTASATIFFTTLEVYVYV